jgi:DNA-binding GntR family transcriptional regulator
MMSNATVRTAGSGAIGANDNGGMQHRTELSREIASYVRDLIMSGQLRSGDALIIDRLAKELDTSITPVREALQTLRAEGFARFEPRRGFRVAPLSHDDVRDLFLVQAQLAGELAARAAACIDRETLARVEELQELTRMAADRGAADEVADLNFRFHRTINHAAGSPKLRWLLGTVVRYAPRRYYAAIPGWLEASVRDHESIIEALRSHDGERARAAATRHVEHACDLLVTHLEEQGFWADELPGDGER